MKVATFSIGLPGDSRVMKRISNNELTLTEMLLSMLVDGVNRLVWQRTKDGAKNRNHPESLYKKLMKINERKKDEYESFSSVEDFNRWYEGKHKCQR